MILGIGSDLVDIRRIEESLSRFGKKFENRVFTPREQEYARRSQNTSIKAVSSTYAKRFAAKEACYKALDIAGNSGISWLDIEVVGNQGGKPEIVLHGNALKIIEQHSQAGSKVKIFVSLSDEYPYAQAYVVIEIFSI